MERIGEKGREKGKGREEGKGGRERKSGMDHRGTAYTYLTPDDLPNFMLYFMPFVQDCYAISCQ